MLNSWLMRSLRNSGVRCGVKELKYQIWNKESIRKSIKTLHVVWNFSTLLVDEHSIEGKMCESIITIESRTKQVHYRYSYPKIQMLHFKSKGRR
jgi:hypothetical protein